MKAKVLLVLLLGMLLMSGGVARQTVFNVSGRVVAVLPEVVDGQSVSLSDGIYIVSSEQCPRPVKFIVHR